MSIVSTNPIKDIYIHNIIADSEAKSFSLSLSLSLFYSLFNEKWMENFHYKYHKCVHIDSASDYTHCLTTKTS